jgi:hypothetical protein
MAFWIVTASTAAPLVLNPPCACFSLCTDLDASDFFSALPVVRSADSPWYPYLRAIYYQAEPPLPIDLRTFGLFRLPSDARPSRDTRSFRLPIVNDCHTQPEARAFARCDESECARWLEPPEARERWNAVALEIMPPEHPNDMRITRKWCPPTVSGRDTAERCAGGSAPKPFHSNLFPSAVRRPPRGPLGFATIEMPTVHGVPSSSLRPFFYPREASAVLRMADFRSRRGVPNGTWTEVMRHK